MNHYQGHWGFNKDRAKGRDRAKDGGSTEWWRARWVYPCQDEPRKCAVGKDHGLKVRGPVALFMEWRQMKGELFKD